GNRIDVRVAVGADRGLSDRDTADGCDFRGDLGGRQNAPLAGFGALAEFYLEHFHLRVSGDFAQFVVTEVSLFIAYTVLGGAHLEDDIGAAFEVPGRQTSLAGIQPAAAPGGARRQGLDGRFG